MIEQSGDIDNRSYERVELAIIVVVVLALPLTATLGVWLTINAPPIAPSPYICAEFEKQHGPLVTVNPLKQMLFPGLYRGALAPKCIRWEHRK